MKLKIEEIDMNKCSQCGVSINNNEKAYYIKNEGLICQKCHQKMIDKFWESIKKTERGGK